MISLDANLQNIIDMVLSLRDAGADYIKLTVIINDGDLKWYIDIGDNTVYKKGE